MKKNYFTVHINLNQNISAVAVLLLLTVLSYSNCLHETFLLDDYVYLIQQDNLKSTSLVDLFRNGFTGFYRPIGVLSLKYSSALFGLEPVFYHIYNYCLFFLACVLFYFILNHITTNHSLALLTCCLYAVHPINNILINYKTAGNITILIIAMQLSTLLFMKFIDEKKNRYFIGSLIFYFLGLLAHEIAFILPLFLFYFLHYIKNIKLNESIKLVRIFVVVFTVYLYIRWNVLGLELRGGGYGAAGLAELNITLYQYIASLFQLISWYISKLIVPTNILFIWDVRLTDQISLFWTSLIVISLASFSVYNIKYKNNIIAFSTAVFISGFIPVLLASIAYASKTNTVFIEPHWFGFSSIGFFLLVASMLIWVRDKIDNKIWICMMFVMMIAMVTLTRNANTYWHDDETYCTFWLTENSLNGTAWKCKGISYYRKNDKGLHAENYKNCDELAYLGLSIHLFGNREQAYQYYFKAIEEDGNCALAYYGIALLYDGLIDEISQKNSQKFLYKARSISPNFYPIYQLIREGFANKMKKNQYQKIMLLWNEFNRPI